MTEPAPAPPTVFERLLGETEPVRRALYPVVVALVALLVGYGVIDGEQAPLWVGLAVAVLGPGAIEAARSVAWSPASVTEYGDGWQAAADDWEAEARDAYARGLADGRGDADEPGEHAEAEPPATAALERTELPTAAMRAPSRATRCREVEGGQRCALGRGHDGPHLMTTG